LDEKERLDEEQSLNHPISQSFFHPVILTLLQ
jgi:hypothetical protein